MQEPLTLIKFTAKIYNRQLILKIFNNILTLFNIYIYIY